MPTSPYTLQAVLLDSGPLGLLTHPKGSPESIACREWAISLAESGVRVIIPEIIDYELRRELIQARLARSLRLLDQLLEMFDYLPIDTKIMRQAADFWAQARQAGLATADRHAVDGDVILAAQTVSLGFAPEEVVIATANIGHISRFVAAKLWRDISI